MPTPKAGPAITGIGNPEARTLREANETGLRIERFFIPVPGSISLATAPETAQQGSTVMFQDLTLHGLIGTTFLHRYVQTFDTRTGTMTLKVPATSTAPVPHAVVTGTGVGASYRRRSGVPIQLCEPGPA